MSATTIRVNETPIRVSIGPDAEEAARLRKLAEAAKEGALAAAAVSGSLPHPSDTDTFSRGARLDHLDTNTSDAWTFEADGTLTGAHASARLAHRNVQLSGPLRSAAAAGKLWASIRVLSGALSGTPTVRQITSGNLTVGPNIPMTQQGNTWLVNLTALDPTATGFRIDFSSPAGSSVTIDRPRWSIGKPVSERAEPLVILAENIRQEQGEAVADVFTAISSVASDTGSVPTLAGDKQSAIAPAGHISKIYMGVQGVFAAATDPVTMLVHVEGPVNAALRLYVSGRTTETGGNGPTAHLRPFVDGWWIAQFPAEAPSSAAAQFLALYVRTTALPGMVTSAATIDEIRVYPSYSLPSSLEVGAAVQQAIVAGQTLDAEQDAEEYAARDARAYLDGPEVAALLESIVRTEIAAHVSQAGNDTTGDGSYLLPYATITKAMAQTAAGDVIGIRNGGNHLTGAFKNFSGADRRSFVGVGPFRIPAILDFRQYVGGLSWADNGDGTWKATVTHRDTAQPVNNPNNAAESLFSLWSGKTMMQWVVGGTSIAANQAAVAAAPDPAFTVHKTGTSAQDPRTVSGGTSYVYITNINPSGGDFYVADRTGFSIQSGAHRNVTFLGMMNKDNINTGPNVAAQSNGTPAFWNMTTYGHGSHGITGPHFLRGHCYADGSPNPGSGVGDAKGRSLGYGFNVYNDIYADIALTGDYLYARDVVAALFGHGQGGVRGGYKSGHYKSIIGANTSRLISISTTLGEQAFFADGLTVDHVATEEGAYTGQGFEIDGMWTIGSDAMRSKIVLDPSPYGLPNSQFFANFNGVSSGLTLTNCDITFERETSLFVRNNLFARQATATSVPPVVLDGVRDLSAPRNCGTLWQSSSTGSKVGLIIKGGSQLWSLTRGNTLASSLPHEITIKADCRAGIGNLPDGALQTYLDAQGVSHDIEAGVELVNDAGVTIGFTT